MIIRKIRGTFHLNLYLVIHGVRFQKTIRKKKTLTLKGKGETQKTI